MSDIDFKELTLEALKEKFIGQTVSVQWGKDAIWRDKKVVNVIDICGDYLLCLEGHPCCPVNITRLI